MPTASGLRPDGTDPGLITQSWSGLLVMHRADDSREYRQRVRSHHLASYLLGSPKVVRVIADRQYLARVSKRSTRARRAKRRAVAQRQRNIHAPSQMEMETLQMFDRFIRYVQSSGDHEQAAAAARADMRSAADEVLRRACGLDLITVVSSAHVEMIMYRAVTGSEPAAALLELIALVLTCRDSRGDVVRPADAESEFMPPEVLAAAREILESGSLIPLFESPSSDAESAVLFHSIEREISLRNPVYPHMLLDTLRGLFGDQAVNEDCKAAMGFTGLEAVNVMEALRSLTIKELEDRFGRMDAARDASHPHLKSWQRGKEAGQQLPSEEERAAMQEVVDALEDLTANVAQVFIVDPSVVAAHTGYQRSIVEAVLDAFTVSGLTDVDETLERFFRGDNALRTAPIVTDGRGRRMLVYEELALPAVREVIEVRLKATGRQSAYERHRGAWVENAAIDLLERAFPGATVYRGFNYFVPDPNADPPQTDPRRFTKRVEGDGLILVDDIALVIEVKAVSLTAEARGGVARRLRGKLRDIVTNAACQADRLRERIVVDGRIRLDDDEWIDVSGVREIHTIAVGLEDLSGVTTATAMLAAAGILSPESIPWTVSVHDLRIVIELLERPSELLLYLRRRTHPEATVKYRAVDELDLFLLFLKRGLYVEPDPRQVAQTLSWAGTPSEADLRRFEAQQPEAVDSYTEPLDAWYASQLNPAAPPADKPRLAADKRFLELVDRVIGTGAPGWLSTATWLSEGDAKVQRRFGRRAAELAKRVRADRKRHSVTHLIGDPSGKQVLLVWVCLGRSDDVDTATPEWMQYLRAKKHQMHAYQAACMIFDPTGKHLLRLLYDNQPTAPDPELDKDVARLGLVPIEQMTRLR